MKLTKIWVAIFDSERSQTRSFVGIDIEDCVRQLHNYLDINTEPGTRAEVVECGYVESGAADGI
jgi:hypothetical protein